MSTAHLVVIVPSELAPGFGLAGASVRVADTAPAAAEILETLLTDGERGVIAVYEPHFAALDTDERVRLDGSVAPVVVSLPTGLMATTGAARRSRLAGLLQRAVGYHITFGGDE